MTDIKKSLDDIFDARSEAERIATEKREAEEAKQREFVDQFIGVRDDLVKPAMEEMKAMLQEKGITSEITVGNPEVKRSVGGHETVSNASIEMRMYEQSRRGAHYEHPSLTVMLMVIAIS